MLSSSISAAAEDLSTSVAPATWAEALTPEALPALKFAAFDDDLDKARQQAFAGRYKLALQTLRTAKSKTAGDVEHVRAQCLIALGRLEEALAATQDVTAVTVQLDRADVLARLGRDDDAVELHDDEDHAKKELAAALKINPNAPDALRLAGLMSVDGYEFDRADGAVAALREVDPQSIDADLIETRNLLRQRMPREAEDRAEAVLQRRPNDIDAMSLRAAAEALQLHNSATQSLLNDIDRLRPHEAAAYFEVAEQLGAMRQYPRSAAMYKIAVDRAPWWTAPRNGLGLLYTQSGDEDAARATLDAAHTLDPFNVDTTNYLRLLDELSKFAKVETPHFTLRFDAALDPLIPEYYPDYLEKNYPAVTSEYKTEPAEKTIIEVFPTHDAFSVRTTGAPWIGTVGASTGRVIAMVSPRKGENTMGTFNWSQVLRHEFTHTVTLAATDNRISHWMTEGLAVMEERSPLQWAWVPMLYQAVSKHQLFDMENLTWAFIRPKKPADRQLGYAESFWVCTYIKEKWGFDAILQMLAEFKAGGLQPDVFPRVLGQSENDFFVGFQKWCDGKIAGWGYSADDQAKYDSLREQGEQLVSEKNYVDAVGIWEQIAALRPVDELPHQRLAGLYLSHAVNQPLKAIDHLKILHQVDLKDDRFAKRISRIYRDTGDLANARDWALQAIYIDPYDPDSHALLLGVCQKMNDTNGVSRENRVIAELATWKATMAQ